MLQPNITTQQAIKLPIKTIKCIMNNKGTYGKRTKASFDEIRSQGMFKQYSSTMVFLTQ